MKFVKYLKKFFEQKINDDVKIGDYVKVISFDNLTDKQLGYLKLFTKYKVKAITNRLGDDYNHKIDNIKYYDIGYKIPLKASRFEKIDSANYKKVLFLQYEHNVNFYGEEDRNNYFRGLKTIKNVYLKLIEEKKFDTKVDFYDYSDIYRMHNDFYVDDLKLSDYDFIFFGFMHEFTTISKLVVDYAERNNIPNIKYETYEHFHNKAYQFDLLERLGYPYIPSILTTKLNKNVLSEAEEFGFPVIVKDPFTDRGEGVKLISNKEELKYFFLLNKGMVLIQKFIPNDGEYRVITVKNKVELIAKKDAISKVDKKNIDNRKSKKGTLPNEVTKMCEDISKHMLSDIIGFDIIQDKDTKKYYVIETNASPHYCMFSVVADVSIPDIICDYIIDNMKK